VNGCRRRAGGLEITPRTDDVDRLVAALAVLRKAHQVIAGVEHHAPGP
jgi:hypothetical protein